MKTTRLRRTLGGRALLAVVAVATTGLAHARMDTTARVERGARFVPRPDRIRALALGFDAVVADFYWMQAVQVVGGPGGNTSQFAPLIARLIDVVTTVDPWVDHPYRFAAVWLTDSLESVRRANRLLLRGIAHHPDDWRNRYHLGFNRFFYLEDERGAADILESAVGLEGAPSYVGALVARLRSEAGGGLETAAALLGQLVRNAGNEYERVEYLKALDEIETERRARFLDAARIEYWKRNGRDIERIEDLLGGPQPVLQDLPSAHPQFDGWAWWIDPETKRIVSSFYRSRYELHLHPRDKSRRERWRARRGEEAEGSG